MGEPLTRQERNRRILTVAIFGAIGVAMFVRLRSQEPAPTPAPTVDMRRLFRENHQADDAAREYIFRGSLKKAGQRCDSVTGHLMAAPGVWTVRCAPGYAYQFTFDDQGQLTGARRLF